MMGRQNNDQGHLFYEFRLDEAVPDDHLVRKIAAVLDLSWVHAELAPHYPSDCRACPLKVRCCPKAPFRRIPRSIYEEARDVVRALAKTEAFEQSCRERKRVEMLFAHLKRILKLGRLRLRGPRGAHDEFTLAAIAQNLRRLAKLVVRPPPMAAACVA